MPALAIPTIDLPPDQRDRALIDGGRVPGLDRAEIGLAWLVAAAGAEAVGPPDHDEAAALVVTINAPRAAEEIVARARAARPDLTIVARARDAHHATVLYGLGVTDAIPETIEASLQLSEAVLVDVGVPMGHVIASIHERRDEYRRLLQPAAEAPRRERRAIRLSTRVKDAGKRGAVEAKREV